MEKEQYDACRTSVSGIDFMSSSAKTFINKMESFNKEDTASTKAKLYIYSDGSSLENTLCRDEVNAVVSIILKKYKDKIENYQKELNTIIDYEILKISESIEKCEKEIEH